jgi:hypothetical protein
LSEEPAASIFRVEDNKSEIKCLPDKQSGVSDFLVVLPLVRLSAAVFCITQRLYCTGVLRTHTPVAMEDVGVSESWLFFAEKSIFFGIYSRYEI